MKKTLYFIASLSILMACQKNESGSTTVQPVYQDVPYSQDYAIKYHLTSEVQLKKVFTDRNGIIQVLSSKGVLRPNNGHFQYPGTLEPDISYVPMADKKVKDMILYQDQFVYLDGEAFFSNAWAGKLFTRHQIDNPESFTAGSDFHFLITSQKEYRIIGETTTLIGAMDNPILASKYADGHYYLLTSSAIRRFNEKTLEVTPIYSGDQLTSFDFLPDNKIAVGTNNGYLVVNNQGEMIEEINSNLPWPEITNIKYLKGNLWFGSKKGAFMLKGDGKFNYYFGDRWLPGDEVTHIAKGPDNAVLVLTKEGLGQILFKEMTLEEKAMIFEKQVRHRHIRYGIMGNVSRVQGHQLATNQNTTAASDNLWTGMYLGSQLFRYLVTNSEEARQNYSEAFEAMERLHEINNIKGLFGRTYERSGYHPFRKEYRDYVENYWYEGYNNNISWNHSDDPEWDWQSTASSDQAVGQMFAMMLVAEYSDDEDLRKRAITIIDDFMGYLIENNYTLIDVNGKPSLWGRWNPEYVNRFETMIGDRKVYASNLIAFLQAAYRFTGKEVYKEKAYELMTDHGYLENLTRPFKEIGRAPETADAWSKMLSEEWNHSDDEMYFLAYWGLYPYAFDDSLKSVYQEAIRDHWAFEQPEKNSLWNFCYAMTGVEEFDLEASIWHLKEWPLDMIQYETRNSHRKDLEFLEPNFRGQTTKEVLPPDERPELKHNKNLFTLDGGDRRSELSAGDTYLLPYWMGRYLGVISAPKE